MPRLAFLCLAILCNATALVCCAETRSQSLSARVGEEVTLSIGATAAWATDLQIRFVAVTEDSRCPTDTTCVWAGQLKISVGVTRGGQTSTLEVIESEQQTIGEYRLSFVRAEPPARANRKLASQEYRVTLRLDRS
jgi:hypothetical protein